MSGDHNGMLQTPGGVGSKCQCYRKAEEDEDLEEPMNVATWKSPGTLEENTVQ